MPGITNPAEEYFKDGLWAWDPAGGEWLKLIIDPLTNRLVIDHPGDVEVVQPVPNDLRVGTYGWDGSAWHKLSMVWGYSDRWAEALSEAKVGDGPYEKLTVAVPAGQVYVLEFVEFQNNTGLRGDVTFGIKDGANIYAFEVFTTPAQYEICTWFGRMTLKAGDQVSVVQASCLNGDALYGIAWGYKMKVVE